MSEHEVAANPPASRLPDLGGYATCTAVVLLAFNLWPGFNPSLWLQIGAVAAGCLLARQWWKKEDMAPMTIWQAAKQMAGGVAIVLGLAALDSTIGYARCSGCDILTAFASSGVAGAPVDLFLAASLLVVLLPSCVRSVLQRHLMRRQAPPTLPPAP